MKSSNLLFTAAILITSTALLQSVHAQDTKSSKPTPTARFEQFKALEGAWEGKSVGESPGETMTVVYHVTSGGTAVTETVGPGTDHEMVTIITKDGDNLALTHYCIMGNQPHMKAPATGTGNAVAFKFAGGGNMKSDQEAHMHNVTYTFIDKDTIKSEWTLFDKGKASGTVAFLLTRKKA